MQHRNDGEEFEGQQPGDAARAAAFEEEQLRLADEDERLPWLESDDDYADDSVDTGRLLMVGIVGLLTVLGLVALAWYLSRPGEDDALLAEGSTIEAPAEPYRTRPDVPGGQPVDGTGDVSFAVGEGETREGQVGAGTAPATAPAVTATRAGAAPAAARPAIDRNQAARPAAPAAAAVPAGGAAVQVAAFSSRARAEQGWSELSGRFQSLQGLQHRVIEASVDGSVVYRLQALTGTAASAETVCRSIRAAGGDCQVKR